jgi:hypothetical protein
VRAWALLPLETVKSMKSLGRIWWGAAMSLLLVACSSSNPGTPATGGTGQLGGSGGVTAALQLPSCVQELLAPCTPDGTCAATAGPYGEICFDSRASATIGYLSAPQACGAGISSLQVRKADGSSCYTYEVYFDADTGCGTRHRWKDAAGTLVATGVSAAGETTTISCETTAETRSCGEPGTPRSECCGVTMYGGAVCPGGFRDSSCGAGRCPTGTGGAGGGTAGSGGSIGTAGAGGATGAAGTTGAAGSGAGGSTAGRGGAGGGTAGSGGGTGDLELPDCVKALVAPCATAGTCTWERTDGGALSEICFDSGVRASFMGDYAAGAGIRVVQVKKADGAPCYSFETSSTTGGEILRYVWKDAAGQVVATGDSSPFTTPTRHQITCASGGQTKMCNASAGACCRLAELGNATCGSPLACGAGTCP